MEFSKLRGRMAEKGYTGRSMAKELGISDMTFYQKMTGKTDWKLSEIYRIKVLLDIDDLEPYFFTPKLRYTKE